MTERFAPAVVRGPSNHSYPTGNWRTRASAYGRDGSAAKCCSSATVHPSQKAESAGSSRRRPRCQDARGSSSIHHSRARCGRRARRWRPLPRSVPPVPVPVSAVGRGAGLSSRTARSVRSPRATAGRSPGPGAGPPSRTAPRGWPGRPDAARARPRVPPRGGRRECSCPIPHDRRRRSAARVRRTAAGRSVLRRGGRGRSCGPAYEAMRSNRRSRQWTRPIFVPRREANRWPNPAANRNSWRTVVHPQPHSAYDRGSRP